MRVSCPWRPSNSWAAPMSITAKGAPPAPTLPATSTTLSVSPVCNEKVLALKRARALAFKNTAWGANRASRSASALGRGIRAGAMVATTRASTPTTRKGTRLPPGATAWVLASKTGEASATCACRATFEKTASSKLP